MYFCPGTTCMFSLATLVEGHHHWGIYHTITNLQKKNAVLSNDLLYLRALLLVLFSIMSDTTPRRIISLVIPENGGPNPKSRRSNEPKALNQFWFSGPIVVFPAIWGCRTRLNCTGVLVSVDSVLDFLLSSFSTVSILLSFCWHL